MFNLKSMPVIVTDFGKGRYYITINFIIDEGSVPANELEMMDWSWFIRNHCFKADHCYLRLGSYIRSSGESGSQALVDSSEGIEGKVLRFVAKQEANEAVMYCTLQFAHCVELEIV